MISSIKQDSHVIRISATFAENALALKSDPNSRNLMLLACGGSIVVYPLVYCVEIALLCRILPNCVHSAYLSVPYGAFDINERLRCLSIAGSPDDVLKPTKKPEHVLYSASAFFNAFSNKHSMKHANRALKYL